MAGADFTVPKGMKNTDLAEFAAQFGNLFASALIKACVSEGYSAQ
jgi:hypothetical protein